eukprot:COSAG05_NODE_828_length_7101_cov_4.298915_4_plen_144_part_00
MRLATWLAVGLLCTASASAKDACRCADAPRCNAKKPEYVEACLEGDPTNNGTTSAVDEKTTKEECENIEVGGKKVCMYAPPHEWMDLGRVGGIQEELTQRKLRHLLRNPALRAAQGHPGAVVTRPSRPGWLLLAAPEEVGGGS